MQTYVIAFAHINRQSSACQFSQNIFETYFYLKHIYVNTKSFNLNLLLYFLFKITSRLIVIITYFLLCRTLAVLGAGLMGAGIAQVTVDKGIKTIIKDTSQQGLSRGLGQIMGGFDNHVKRKKISA